MLTSTAISFSATICWWRFVMKTENQTMLWRSLRLSCCHTGYSHKTLASICILAPTAEGLQNAEHRLQRLFQRWSNGGWCWTERILREHLVTADNPPGRQATTIVPPATLLRVALQHGQSFEQYVAFIAAKVVGLYRMVSSLTSANGFGWKTNLLHSERHCNFAFECTEPLLRNYQIFRRSSETGVCSLPAKWSPT